MTNTKQLEKGAKPKVKSERGFELQSQIWLEVVIEI